MGLILADLWPESCMRDLMTSISKPAKRVSAGHTGGNLMSDNTEQTEAGRQYAAAYETHYGSKNLQETFALYKKS